MLGYISLSLTMPAQVRSFDAFSGEDQTVVAVVQERLEQTPEVFGVPKTVVC